MQQQEQKPNRRPKCLVKDCMAKACPSGTGYCSRHDWERTPLGQRPSKMDMNFGDETVGAVASQKHSSNIEKQHQSGVRALPFWSEDDE
jgi:hypothetical protein